MSAWNSKALAPHSSQGFYHITYLFTRIGFNERGVNMKEKMNLMGNIYVSHRAISSIAYQAAIESYGVVGLAAKNFAEGISNALVKDPTMGVEVKYDGHSIQIDLYIVVEYGTRIKMVAETVSSGVRYRVEKTIGIPVDTVNVHIRGLRISNPD